jgi:xylulokinase
MLSMSLGTSGTLFTCAAHPVVDDGAGWAAFCSSSGGWLPLVCTMNCTVATDAVARAFGFTTRDGEVVLRSTRPGADGLGMLPFLNGERTPDLPQARGSVYGLQPDNFTWPNAYRAAMEGATYALRNGYDALRAANLSFDAIRLTGGGSHSTAWRQMVADVFELPVEVPAQQEGAAFGAALQALWACETRGSADELTSIVREHVLVVPALAAQPDGEAVLAYRVAYHQFQRHLQTAKSLYSAAAAG